MARLIIRLLGRRGALIACGIVLVIVGLIAGAVGSHQVSYEDSLQIVSYHVNTGTQSGNVYINADGSSDYFVAQNGNFNPPIAQSEVDNSSTVSFVARTDTTSINLDVNGTTISEAHPIEKLIFYDKNGNVLSTHTTADYTNNPNGFYVNQWPYAIWFIIVGVILGVGAFLFPMLRKRPRGSASIPAAAVGAQPSQPYQQYQQPDPYRQTYQGPGQYPQYPQSAPYPPQQPGYGQPGSNPYQQPPQEH